MSRAFEDAADDTLPFRRSSPAWKSALSEVEPLPDECSGDCGAADYVTVPSFSSATTHSMKARTRATGWRWGGDKT